MSEKKKKHGRHSARQYFTVPLLYVLISLIAVVPICLALLHFAVGTFHKVQPAFSRTAYDFTVNDDKYTESDITSGTVTLPPLKYGDKIGELRSTKAGISASVYYGRNIISHKFGVGLYSKDQVPGENGTVTISGNVSGPFKSLKTLEVGDEIHLNTSWGDYVYTVSEVTVSVDAPDAIFPQNLLLSTASDNKVFSALNEEQLYVLAECKSGPQAEGREVQQ